MFSSKFIKATSDYCTYEKSVSAPYIRKSFTLAGKPEKATVTMTSTGFYRFFVNGRELTASRLAPAISNPDDLLFYDTYDVSEYLSEGENVLGFILGNGISNCIGGYIWDFDKAVFRSSPKLAVSFESDELSFEADGSFKTAPSPIYFDDLRSGEFYDANAEIDSWCSPDFDDEAWCFAIETESPRGEKLANQTDKIVVTKELFAGEIVKGTVEITDPATTMRPDSITLSESAFYKPEKGETGYIFKFAENAACVPKLKIKGRKGQKIIIQAGEYCSDDNVLSFANINSFYPLGFSQRDIYICHGEGVEEYVPSFTYHGARYFMVIGADDDQIAPDTVTMLVQNSNLAERGGFECSNEIANKLQRAARVSDLANFVYFPTDCPHREKNGWTGDAAMSAEHMTQNLAPENSYRQWLKQICASQKPNGSIPGIVPTSGWGFDWGNGPAWDEVLTELAFQTYKYRGDTELFGVVSDAVFKYLNYVSKRRDSHGLIAIGLGDWCHAMRDGGSNHVCPLEVSDTAIVYNMCSKAEIMYRATGLSLQANFCRAFGDELRSAFRARLIDFATMTVKGKCQAAQSIGLYYGLFDNAEIQTAYARLVELIHEKGDHFDCGMVGVRTIFRVLGEHGDAELAFRMITQPDAPSYAIMVEQGKLVSLAESFHNHYDGHITSLNHHFMGDISGFFISHLAGIRVNPTCDDCRHVDITPTFIPELDHASAFYDTVNGRISVMWERCGDEVKITVSKPDGIYGDIILPNGYEFSAKDNAPDYWMVGRREYKIENVTYTARKAR